MLRLFRTGWLSYPAARAVRKRVGELQAHSRGGERLYLAFRGLDIDSLFREDTIPIFQWFPMALRRVLGQVGNGQVSAQVRQPQLDRWAQCGQV